MTRIAFTADLHVDAYGSRIDPATGLNARLVDYLGTLTWVAAEASNRNAEALVVAGDFTERRHPAPWLVSQVRGALDSGPARQIYLRGNHDGEIAGGSIVSILDDGGETPEYGRRGVSRPRLDVISPEVVLACLPYLDRHFLRAQPGLAGVPEAELYRVIGDQFLTLARALYAEARRDYPDAACVLVCHQGLAGAAMTDSQRAFLGDVSTVVDSRALADIGFEAVVAGHLHRHQVVVPGDRPVLYTGSIERVDFGEEHETKGFIVADVERGRFEWEFVETPARRFVTLHSLDALVDTSIEGAVVRFLDADEDPAVIRASLESYGPFEITEVRRRPADPVGLAAGGLSESLTAEQALDAYLPVDDPDREPLLERGRGILAEVS